MGYTTKAIVCRWCWSITNMRESFIKFSDFIAPPDIVIGPRSNPTSFVSIKTHESEMIAHYSVPPTFCSFLLLWFTAQVGEMGKTNEGDFPAGRFQLWLRKKLQFCYHLLLWCHKVRFHWIFWHEFRRYHPLLECKIPCVTHRELI